MNFNAIIRPFTEAVCKTKKIPLPTEATVMCETSRRFLFDMVSSEIGEFCLAKTDADKIDALVDAIIYITDSCLRHGIEPVLPQSIVPNETWQCLTPYYLFNFMTDFIVAETVEDQTRCLSAALFGLCSSSIKDVHPFVELVAKANEQKILPTGFVTLNEQGKVMKPANFVPPDLSTLL